MTSPIFTQNNHSTPTINQTESRNTSSNSNSISISTENSIVMTRESQTNQAEKMLEKNSTTESGTLQPKISDGTDSTSNQNAFGIDSDVERGIKEKQEGENGIGNDETIWVEWEENDPENPFNFSAGKKWLITGLTTFFTAEVAATAGAFVSGIPSMQADLGVHNDTVALLGVSLYALGFGLPPLVLAPFSEIFGRRPVYLVTHLAYTIFFIGVGSAQNIQTVLICRFLGGAMGSTGSTLTGGLLADIWKTSERGNPMAIFATAAIFGTGIGPVFAGWIENNPSLGWRWINWVQAIYTGVSFIALCLFLKETRGSVLLTRRAATKRKETGNPRYRAKAESERASIQILVKNSLFRPLSLLITEPIVFVFSLWISLLWGFMYMLLKSIGLITELHNYTPGQTGLVFISICVAALIGQATNIFQERLYAKKFVKKGPEARLYASCVAAVAFPIGCFIYGWTAYPQVSIAGPIIGIIVLMTSVYHVYLAVFNYLSDAYLIYASSALASQSFCRNLFGFAFPLFVTPMYKNLGYQWASSLAGFLGAVLGLAPFILMWKGKEIRSKSRFSTELQRIQDQKDKENKN